VCRLAVTKSALFYSVAYLVFAVCGVLITPFFFAFHLLDIGARSKELKYVISSVTQNGTSIILTVRSPALYVVSALSFAALSASSVVIPLLTSLLLGLQAILALIVIYIYTIFGFLFFRDKFIQDDVFICESMLMCFVNVVNYGSAILHVASALSQLF